MMMMMMMVMTMVMERGGGGALTLDISRVGRQDLSEKYSGCLRTDFVI